MSDNELIDEFQFEDVLDGEKQNQWLNVNIYKIVQYRMLYYLQFIFSYMFRYM